MPHADFLLNSKLRHGKELIAARRFEEARSVYQELCARRKSDADCWFTLGVINGILKRHHEAAACCAKAVELAPRHEAAWYNLGIAFRDMRQLENAAQALRKAFVLNPRNQAAATSLGHVLSALHRYEEAEELFRKLLSYQSGNAEFYVVYGSAMQTMGRFEAAINAYRKAIDIGHPRAAEVHENMAAALCMQGKYRESIDHYDAALKREPHNPRIHSNLLLTLHYLVGQNAQSLFESHCQWRGNAVWRERPRAHVPVTGRSGDPPRLRVGYVSSDLRKHSVAYFLEPLLAHHDTERFEIACYFAHKDADATTERLQRLVHRWRDVVAMDDGALCRQIADDGIDILVDLNGHTSGNRLTAFARRAAPVQVTFIGYPDTTGVVNMDFRLSDAIADPPGAERLCTEFLYRLPGCFLCYGLPDDAPPVQRLPWERNGFVTFGSFNNLAKVNLGVIAIWSELLRAIPDSRLILKNPSLTDAATRERFQGFFADAGISAARLDLIGYIPDDAGHLGAYSRIDVALDTFPYNGTTTTCEALSMGVPVISLQGDRHSARVGASLLTAAGFPGWVADTPERYVQLGRELASDRVILGGIRSHLRERVCRSRLCCAADYARSVEKAYEEMYARSRAAKG